VHSCDAQAKDEVCISNVFGFNREIFNGVDSHHNLELSVRGVASHGLGLRCNDGILDLALGRTFVALVVV
jgi:hypothetical protein